MRDQTRREFLINAMRLAGGGLAGLAALHTLGPSAVEDARALGLMQAQIGSGGGGVATVSWANWNQTDQEALNAAYSCVYAGGAGEDDIGFSGKGLLTGSGLVQSQVGDVGAWEITEGGRPIGYNSLGDYFNSQDGALDLLNGCSLFTVMIRINNYQAQANNYVALYAGNAAGDEFYFTWSETDIRCSVTIGGANGNGVVKAGTITGNTDVILALWGNASHVRMGIAPATPKPTTEAAFTDYYETHATGKTWPAAATWTVLKLGAAEGYIQFLVIDNTCLFS